MWRAVNSLPNADPYLVNRQPHKIVVNDTSGDAVLDVFTQAKLSMDKANMPVAGRIAIVDPIVAARLESKITLTSSLTDNPLTSGILQGGFAREHEFVTRFAGFTVITSNRLPVGTYNDGTTTITDGVGAVFMCVANDNTKPMMMAWRRMPRTEFFRNPHLKRDEFITNMRFGIGTQRIDSLFVAVFPSVGLPTRPESAALPVNVVNADDIGTP